MRRNLFLLALCAFIALASAASPDSFCKCTCFSNSTIIKLGTEQASPSDDFTPSALRARAGGASASCNMCNRAFCLSYNLPICKGAEEKDVFTACFQRDSSKDQIIVLLFISITLGLLGWAGVQKILERRAGAGAGASAVPVGQYASLPGR